MYLSAYRPHPLLRSGHLQTLMVGLACGYRPPRNARTLEVQLPDEERLIVHEEQGGSLPEEAPLAILVHGLGGDHAGPYLQRIAHRMRQYGSRVWRIDLRGHGHGLRLAWRPAHAGSSQDLAAVVTRATELYPGAPIRIVGFSLGGNIVLKMLSEAATGELAQPIELRHIESALAIAPPVSLHACADNMDRTTRRIYTHYYLRILDRQVQLRRKHWEQWKRVPQDPRVRSIRQFDARYTAPLSGFRSTDHYYSEASAGERLSAIQTPTTILVDHHDPIVTHHSVCGAVLNPRSTQIVETSHGGHMGYFGIDANGRLIRWMEEYVIHFLRAKDFPTLPLREESGRAPAQRVGERRGRTTSTAQPADDDRLDANPSQRKR